MGREEYQAGDLVFAILMLFIVLVLLVSIPFETKWFDGVPLVKQPRLWPTFCLLEWLFLVCFIVFRFGEAIKFN